MSKREPTGGPDRIPPAAATADALERIAPKRPVHLEPGDVLITREAVPSLRPTPTGRWRFRLTLPQTGQGRTFNSFQHAASEGEMIASERHARLVYREEDVLSILNDYRY